MLNILIALLIFGFLILIHEFGHYVMARRFKVGIREFSIGMGPKLFGKTSQKTGISYSLRLLPIGGYVSMEGEDEDSDNENALPNKPIYQRFFIMVAGALMNLLVGVLLTCVLVLSTKQLFSTTVSSFVDGAPSKEAGLCEGDKILSIGGQRVYTGYDLAYTIMHDAVSGPIPVVVLRDGEKLSISVEFPTIEESGVLFGARDFYLDGVSKSFGTVLYHSFHQSLTSIRMIWESLVDLLTGRYGVDQLSGPVGIVSEVGNAVEADDGGFNLLYLTALIALNLGIFNLLPFPALDGGRILFLLIELILRKPVPRKVEEAVNLAGLALLMLLMLFVTFQDVSKLIH